MTNEIFVERYNDVFDENGVVKLCGRDKCKDLIIACMSLDVKNPEGFYGTLATGMMNVENIKKLKESLEG